MVRKIFLAGIAAYILLLVFAVMFYLERTVFVDVAYIFFHILKSGSFAIQEYRFGSAVTQAIIVAGGRLGLGLDSIAFAYSAGVALYYLLCYLACGLVFRNYRMALVLLLCHTLFVADSFFWIQAELAQGLAFMIVVFAGFTSGVGKVNKLTKYIILPVSVITMSFFHPLIFIPALYLVLFLWLRKDDAVNKKLLIAVAVVVLLSVLAKTFLFKSGYDSNTTDKAIDSLKLLPSYFSFSSTRIFLQQCVYKYYWIPIAGIGIIIFYLRHKRFAVVSLFAAVMCGYLLLVNTSFREGIAPFYIENLYLPVGVLLAVPLVYDVLPAMRPLWGYVLISLIAVTGIARIYNSHKPYTARLQWEENFLTMHREGKWVYDDSHVPMDTLMMNWGTPYEFWLLSTMKYGKTASIMIADDADAFITPAFNRMDFLAPYESVPYSELTGPYFKLTDTLSRYKVVSPDE